MIVLTVSILLLAVYPVAGGYRIRFPAVLAGPQYKERKNYSREEKETVA